MKHVNTMAMEELSEDQIAAARARRSKERCVAPLTEDLCTARGYYKPAYVHNSPLYSANFVVDCQPVSLQGYAQG